MKPCIYLRMDLENLEVQLPLDLLLLGNSDIATTCMYGLRLELLTSGPVFPIPV